MEDNKLNELANEIEWYNKLLRYATFFKEQKECGRMEISRSGDCPIVEESLHIYRCDDKEVYEKFCLMCAKYFEAMASFVKFKIENKLKKEKEGD